jgi:hypothetical protein
LRPNRGAAYKDKLTRARGRVLAVQWARVRIQRVLERRPFPTRGAIQTVLEELGPKEPKAKTSRLEDFVDLRALQELEREGGFR